MVVATPLTADMYAVAGNGDIGAVSMQSDVTTDVSLSGGSGTAVTNDLGWLDEVKSQLQ